MTAVVLTSEEFNEALETARRDMEPVQVEPRKVMFHASFARWGNDSVQYHEEMLLISRQEADAYLANHPMADQYQEWGYCRWVREIPIG